jgi:hypothetical protein
MARSTARTRQSSKKPAPLTGVDVLRVTNERRQVLGRSITCGELWTALEAAYGESNADQFAGQECRRTARHHLPEAGGKAHTTELPRGLMTAKQRAADKAARAKARAASKAQVTKVNGKGYAKLTRKSLDELRSELAVQAEAGAITFGDALSQLSRAEDAYRRQSNRRPTNAAVAVSA